MKRQQWYLSMPSERGGRKGQMRAAPRTLGFRAHTPRRPGGGSAHQHFYNLRREGGIRRQPASRRIDVHHARGQRTSESQKRASSMQKRASSITSLRGLNNYGISVAGRAAHMRFSRGGPRTSAFPGTRRGQRTSDLQSRPGVRHLHHCLARLPLAERAEGPAS